MKTSFASVVLVCVLFVGFFGLSFNYPSQEFSGTHKDPHVQSVPRRRSTERVDAALVMSIEIRHSNRHHSESLYHRLDVARMTLLSYARIPFSEVHLFFSVEKALWARPLQSMAEVLFGDRLKTMKFPRLQGSQEWANFINVTLGQKPDDYPVFVSTSDDHVFIDENLDAILEGIRHISNSSWGPWRMAYIMHFPEAILQVASCTNTTRRAGNYWITANYNLFDGTMIVNLGLLKIRIALAPPQLVHLDGMLGYNTPEIPFQAEQPRLFVPLREQTRNFAGYAQHPGIDAKWVPPLTCPPEKNQWAVDREALIARMIPPSIWHTAWTEACEPKEVPSEWVQWMLLASESFHGHPFKELKGIVNCNGSHIDQEGSR